MKEILPRGTVVDDRYKILFHIANVIYGACYKCLDTKKNCCVELYVLNKTVSDSDLSVIYKRLEEYDSFIYEGTHYIASENIKRTDFFLFGPEDSINNRRKDKRRELNRFHTYCSDEDL